MLTLTLVNTNRDENGELKADPLVKRVTGLPGEQLMMMDGTLYARTASSPEFVPVKADSEWAAWNLNELPASTKKQIQTFPISQENAQVTLDVENERRNLDLVSAALECKSLSADFRRYARGKDIGLENVKKLFSERDFYVMSLFSSLDKNLSVLMKDDGGAEWVEHFLTDWYMNLGGVSALNGLTEEGSVTGPHLAGGDLYTDSLFRLNVMCKLAYGRILVENAKLISGNASASEILNDSVIRENYRKAQQLAMYLAYMDQRNMPLFPANNEDGSANYLPANSYFMMGDNRYNSLDMRHSYESNYKALYSLDDFSVAYYSNMEPHAVNRSRMLGKASYRFWPVSRAGVPGKGIRK